MAWENILDVGEWDIYIQYVGVSSMPNPDSVENLVLAADLDPAVGSVEIVDGNIELNLEGISGGGGPEPYIVVMPRGANAMQYQARMRVIEDRTDPVFYTGVNDSWFCEVLEVASAGESVYGSVESDVNRSGFSGGIPQGWFDGGQLGAPIGLNSGLGFTRVGSGF